MNDPSQLDRTIVHEAGHGLVAWYSLSVRDVSGMCLHVHGGDTKIAGSLSTAGGFWDAVAIGLAGMAAEVGEFGSVRSGNCKSDISDSRNLADRLIVKYGLRSHPWPDTETGSLDFAKMFREPPAAEIVSVMDTAYRRARRLIRDQRPGFKRLIDALRRKQALTKQDIASLFGPRIWVP